MNLKTKRPTPLTDAFLEDLKKRMLACNPPLKKTELADQLGIQKQMINSWLKASTKKPSSEYLLKIMELMRRNFMRMFL